MNTENYFKFIFSPYKIDDIKEIIRYSEKLSIPREILIFKLVEYFIIEKNDLNYVIENLLKIDVIDDKETEIVVDYIKVINNRKYNDNDNILSASYINLLSKNFKICDSKHEGYPEIDDIKGRPYIDWLECYYKDCHKKFNNEKEFIEHLKYFNAYSSSFHKNHEDAISKLNLDEKIVKEKNYTVCPSYSCYKQFKTCDDLCEHFKELGIKPFWNEKYIKKTKKEVLKNIYFADECVICMNEQPNILFLPCQHINICLLCYNDLLKLTNLKNCPVCSIEIKNLIMF